MKKAETQGCMALQGHWRRDDISSLAGNAGMLPDSLETCSQANSNHEEDSG